MDPGTRACSKTSACRAGGLGRAGRVPGVASVEPGRASASAVWGGAAADGVGSVGWVDSAVLRRLGRGAVGRRRGCVSGVARAGASGAPGAVAPPVAWEVGGLVAGWPVFLLST